MARAENLAIMFVDMAGFAERTARQSRQQNKAMLRDFYRLMLPQLARFGGNRVKSLGDAFLVTFRSPTDAVRCSMALQDAVAAYNDNEAPPEPLQIRVALNVGEVRLEKGDIFGEAVNIAARVEEITPPGEIYLTGVVYLSMNKAEVASEHVGEYKLKGIPEPMRLFRVPARRLARLTPGAEPLPQVRGELPYGGMHALPADTTLVERMTDALRRAPYVDWNRKIRTAPRRVWLGALAGLAVAGMLAGVTWSVRNASSADGMLLPAPVRTDVSEEARAALASAHTAYFEKRRVDAAAAYARVLDIEPSFRHDSGLAANLVGTLGYAGEVPRQAILKHPSPEFVYELARRTRAPGRIGAQRAAALLTELGQAARIDQRSLAVTELAEAPTCEERLAAVRRLRALRDPRALPALQESVHIGLAEMFRKDRNACLRAEAEKTIAELQKLSPAPPPAS
jgi:class 3 adenylate cyclase